MTKNDSLKNKEMKKCTSFSLELSVFIAFQAMLPIAMLDYFLFSML